MQNYFVECFINCSKNLHIAKERILPDNFKFHVFLGEKGEKVGFEEDPFEEKVPADFLFYVLVQDV